RTKEAGELASKLMPRLTSEGMMLIDTASQEKDGYFKAAEGRRLVKMGTDAGLSVQVAMALKLLEQGDARGAASAVRGFPESYRRFPNAYDDGLVLAAALKLAAKPELAPVAAALLSTAIQHASGIQDNDIGEPDLHALLAATNAVLQAGPNV